MKIKNIDVFYLNPGVAKNLLLCRVTTDEGIYGWGESYVVQGKERVVEEYIRGMAPYMIDRDPFTIRHSAKAMFDDFAIRRSSGDFFSAWSAIEIALWDILGKYLGQPVYKLLGGPCRERIRVYANGWYDVNFGGDDSPEGMAKRALRVKEMGYTAMKWDPFRRSPWRDTLTRQEENQAVESVRAVREAVGPDVDLLIEVHRRLSPYYAARFADRIAQFDPFWFEEPCLADNPGLLVQAKKNIRIPIVTGETKYSKTDFIEVFERECAEIINPDICAAGGLTGLTDIAHMAEAYNVLVSPHNYNSTIIGLAATLHASATLPNFLIAEMFLNVKKICDEVSTEPLQVDHGFIDLPVKPGLGVDINIDMLNKHPYREIKKEFPIKGVRQYYEEYPRKEDFLF